MAGRYQQIFHDIQNYYLNGSPVIIKATAVQKDNENGSVFAQVKLANITDREITGFKVDIFSGESESELKQDVSDFEISGLNAASDEEFGSKTPVYLNNTEALTIRAAVKEVSFSDGTVWSAKGSEWLLVPVGEKVVDRLGDIELVKQYSHEIGKENTMIPVISNGLFMCGCGCMSPEELGKCRKCGKTYEDFAKVLDIEGLKERLDERLRKEEEERLEEERKKALELEAIARKKEEKRRKRRKVMAIALSILLIAAIIAVLTPRYIVPTAKNMIAYKAAEKMLYDGEYDKAKAAFLEIGNFKDSLTRADEAVYLKAADRLKNGKFDEATDLFELIKNYNDAADMARESQYQKAEKLLADKDYNPAIEVWKGLGDYKDSRERVEAALFELHEEDYQKAQKLKDNQDYAQAVEIFEALGDYKDSRAMYEECLELKKESDYNTAVAYGESELYKNSIDILKALGDYKDSQELFKMYSYRYGLVMQADGMYKLAIDSFAEAGDYEDASEKLKGAYYGYGTELLNNGQYEDAIKIFDKCDGYKDSKKLILKAKYEYVNSHKTKSDATTSKYIDELVTANYSGARSIYNELYAWKMEVVAINNSETSTVNSASVSKSSNWYYHLKLSGGPEGGSTYITCKGYFPNGTSTVGTTNAAWSDGDTGYWYFYYYTPAYGSTGTFRADFFDDNGNKIGSASVNLTY